MSGISRRQFVKNSTAATVAVPFLVGSGGWNGANDRIRVACVGVRETYMGRNREPGPFASAGGDHYQNFVDAVRARDSSRLNCSIEEVTKARF